MNITKVMRNFMIAVLLVFLCGLAIRVYQLENSQTYRMHAYVSGYDGDSVRFTDKETENDFWWGDRDDWDMWDNAVLTMNDNGTPADMKDDRIIRVKYERGDL